MNVRYLIGKDAPGLWTVTDTKTGEQFQVSYEGYEYYKMLQLGMNPDELMYKDFDLDWI